MRMHIREAYRQGDMIEEVDCEHVFVKSGEGEECRKCGMRVTDARDLAAKRLKEASIGLTDHILILIYLLPNHTSTADTRLMKEIFLTEREGPKLYPKPPTAGFRPDRYGPCSNNVYMALYALAYQGLVKRVPGAIENSKATILTPDGLVRAKKLIERLDQKSVEEFVQYLEGLDSLDLHHLLRYVYTRYPTYTFKSAIKDKVLKGGERNAEQG